ncbi:replication regulatory protein RepA [Pectobacterium parvum]|uniref:replication regulatory protein RepA n=1 Tax=Pectobacterium parvum TaxID=2778550 RepID=UPI000DD04453|nr:replication regulatory protein RepA [Pectobacterium parvum]
MSQSVNAVSSLSKTKRIYRKGNALSNAEKQRMSTARKRSTHKEVKVFIEPQFKELLMSMCEQDGLTQAEVLEQLIEREARNRHLS